MDATALSGTKLRIVEAALELFSQHGYDAVRVGQIAERVGIRAPSLYKHFKSKQEIFDTVLLVVDQRHESQVAALEMHLLEAEQDAALMRDITEEALFDKVAAMVRFALHDESYLQFRKMLALERHAHPDLAQRYTKRYLQLYLQYHTRLFDALMGVGALRAGDAEVMALQYFSPILVAMDAIDHEPGREDEMMALIRRHVHQFLDAYRTNAEEVRP